MLDTVNIEEQLAGRFGNDALHSQWTADGMPTFWVGRDRILDVLRFVKTESTPAYRMLFDLTAIDERVRENRGGQPASDFTVVYHLLSLEPIAELRLKVALTGDFPETPSATSVWPRPCTRRFSGRSSPTCPRWPTTGR
jgi:NADH-quinone oxidoreductase subunit C/D